jgi:Carbohydrate-selective porin, OprB family/S-layer homology domain
MAKLSWKTLLASPVALTATMFLSHGAIAAPSQSVDTVSNQEAVSSLELKQSAPIKVAQATSGNSTLDQINQYNREGNNNVTIDGVTNVSELKDVSPGDWAYESLRSLVERYGCIAGYPDGTFRGNRAMTRYEFAAGLNSCLKQIEKLIAAQTADFATKEDLGNIDKLKDEFKPELDKIAGRVDGLEGRIGKLEKSQFSTTTKLVGEAIFALTDNFGNGYNQNTIFGDRVRLEFRSSFTGDDVLHTRLTAGNLNAFNPGGSAEGTQTFNGAFATGTPPTNSNSFGLDWLAYEYPIGNANVYIAATGGLFSDFTPTLNPYFDDGDGGKGALSTFAQYNPIYRLGGGAGIGMTYNLGKKGFFMPTSLTLGYLADNANDPSVSGAGKANGLFNGDYAALAQLTFNLSDRFAFAGTYVHGYHSSGQGTLFDSGTRGSLVGNSLTQADGTVDRYSTNSYGLQAAFRLSDKVSLSAFGGTTFARNLNKDSADANIWYYGGGLAFPDLGKKGNLGGIFVGVEPYLTGARSTGTAKGPLPLSSRDTSLHIEGFYKYQLTDNISITPGVIWISAPNQSDANKDAVIGTLRTTFSF